MKIFIVLMLYPCCVFTQNLKYKVLDACISSEVHKGKKDHGKEYCVAWATVREYKDGRKDTISWIYSSKAQWGDEIGKYDKLSERGKYIIDSLEEDGVPQLNDNYLMYEPQYMKYGKKTESMWLISDKDIVIYKYLFWRNEHSDGVKLVKSATLNTGK